MTSSTKGIKEIKAMMDDMKEYLGKEAYQVLCDGDCLFPGSPYLDIWENSKKQDFLNNLFANENTKKQYSTAKLAKSLGYERRMVGIMCKGEYIYTDADAGSVRVGNADFTVNIPNGYGDGECRSIIMDYGQWNTEILEFFNTITVNKENDTYIYNYDCSDGKPLKALPVGRYSVFYGKGIVCFALCK